MLVIPSNLRDAFWQAASQRGTRIAFYTWCLVATYLLSVAWVVRLASRGPLLAVDHYWRRTDRSGRISGEIRPGSSPFGDTAGRLN